MKRKTALRPIRRTSLADRQDLVTASAAARAYPDARSLSAALQRAAARAVRVLAIPAVGLGAGCSAQPTELPISPVVQMPIGKVVEGLKPPMPLTELVPVPHPIRETFVPIDLPPRHPDVVPQTPVPHPDPIPLGGARVPVSPLADPPQVEGGERPVRPDPETMPIRGRMSVVRPDPMPVPGGIRPSEPVSSVTPQDVPVPRTLSDRALEAALASIR